MKNDNHTDKVKARALDKILAHLTRATAVDKRKRERRRAGIALKHIGGFIKESQRELEGDLLQRPDSAAQATHRTGVVG